MAVRLMASQVLEQILSSVDQEDYSDSQEEEEEEEVSEDEDGEEYNPERRKVDDASSHSSGRARGSPRGRARGPTRGDLTPDQRETSLLSKNGKIESSRGLWPPPQGPRDLPHRAGRDSGPHGLCRNQARDIASAFHLFVTPPIERIIVEKTNLHGARKYDDGWRPMDATDLRTYVGLLILVGVYRSRGEATASLWDAESGRTMFRATMPL